MPVSVKKVGNKYRLCEPGGKIATTKLGSAVDGGGHASQEKAAAQARAINMHLHKK